MAWCHQLHRKWIGSQSWPLPTTTLAWSKNFSSDSTRACTATAKVREPLQYIIKNRPFFIFPLLKITKQQTIKKIKINLSQTNTNHFLFSIRFFWYPYVLCSEHVQFIHSSSRRRDCGNAFGARARHYDYNSLVVHCRQARSCTETFQKERNEQQTQQKWTWWWTVEKESRRVGEEHEHDWQSACRRESRESHEG